jgi:hypothetical protein
MSRNIKWLLSTSKELMTIPRTSLEKQRVRTVTWTKALAKRRAVVRSRGKTTLARPMWGRSRARLVRI